MKGARASAAIDASIGRSVNFELTIADLARRSERRAWWVAGVAVVLSLVMAGGYFYILPLKEKVPYLVMADAYSGTSTLTRLRDDAGNPGITSSEAINRSNVAHFILARESYDVAMIKLRDWKTVYTMAGPEVAAAYGALHANNNPASPYNLHGRSQAIRVRILSTSLIGDRQPRGATVRFQRSLYDKATAQSRPLDSKIATLEFSYQSNLAMDEEDRIENPLGFRVTSYRVDNDYASAPQLPEPQQAFAPPVPAVAQPHGGADGIDGIDGTLPGAMP